MKRLSRRAGVIPVVAVAAAVALGLSACAGGGGGEPSTDEKSVLRIDQRAQAESIDPAGALALVDVQLMGLVHGRLFDFAPGEAVKTEPSLAESIEVSEDGLVHTVTLKSDATFSDGSPLTSEDVVASVLRIRDVPGFYQVDAAIFADAVAVDDTTVEFTLTAPLADLTQTLALPSLSIVPAAVADDPDYYAGEPVYSGAYVPEGDWASTSFSLVRNDEYAGPRPSVEEIDVTVMADAATAMLRLQGGETDFTQNVPPEATSQLSGDVEAIMASTLASLFIVPNNAPGSLFEDARIRQAIAWAIDRAALAEVMYRTTDTVNPSPYQGNATYPRPIEPYAERDVAQAKKLLEGTACESGCSFEVSYFASSSESEGRSATVLQQQLSEIGMTVQTTPVEDAQFIDNALSGAYDMSIVETGGFNVPSTLVGNFDPASNQCVNAGCANDAASPAIQALIEAAEGSPEQEAASQAFLELFQEWTPIIPIADSTVPYGVRTSFADTIMVQPNNLYAIAAE